MMRCSMARYMLRTHTETYDECIADYLNYLADKYKGFELINLYYNCDIVTGSSLYRIIFKYNAED